MIDTRYVRTFCLSRVRHELFGNSDHWSATDHDQAPFYSHRRRAGIDRLSKHRQEVLIERPENGSRRQLTKMAGPDPEIWSSFSASLSGILVLLISTSAASARAAMSRPVCFESGKPVEVIGRNARERGNGEKMIVLDQLAYGNAQSPESLLHHFPVQHGRALLTAWTKACAEQEVE